MERSTFMVDRRGRHGDVDGAVDVWMLMERSTFMVDRRGRHRSTMKVDRSMELWKVDRSIS